MAFSEKAYPNINDMRELAYVHQMEVCSNSTFSQYFLTKAFKKFLLLLTTLSHFFRSLTTFTALGVFFAITK